MYIRYIILIIMEHNNCTVLYNNMHNYYECTNKQQ